MRDRRIEAEAREQRLARAREILTQREVTVEELADVLRTLQTDDAEPWMYTRAVEALHGAEIATSTTIGELRARTRLASEERLLERALQRAGRLSELARAAQDAARVEDLRRIQRTTLPDSQRSA